MSRRLLACWVVLSGFVSACAVDEPDPITPEAYSSPEEAAQAKDALWDAPPPAEPMVSVMPEVVLHGARTVPRVALTFDACSTKGNEYDDRITRTLIDEQAKATVFVGGRWAQTHPAVVEMLAANPLFEVGNHTFTHPHMPRVKDDDRVMDELLRTQREIYDLTGVMPRYWRPPYGEYDARVAHLAAKAGLVTVEFDLASGDPDVRHATKKRLIDWVLAKTKPGSIVVMHLNHKNFHTAEALPELIKGLRKKGYELVTMSELMQGQEPVCRDETTQPPPKIAHLQRPLTGADAVSSTSVQ